MKCFLNYFNVVLRAPKLKLVPFGAILAAVALCLINIFAFTDGNWWAAYLSLFGFVSPIIVFYGCYGSPNMEAAFPANHRKKLAYRFLASFFMYLIFIATVVVTTVLIFVIRLIFEYKFRFDYFEYAEMMLDGLRTYGVLFSVAFVLIMYAAGMITGFIKKSRNRNIFLACFCGGVFISYLILAGTYTNPMDWRSLYRLPFSYYYYEQVEIPWLFIAFWFIVAFVMLGCAIYLGVKHYNPKKF